MKKALSLLALGLAASSLVACGGLSEEDAAKGWAATFAATGSVQGAPLPGEASETKNVPCLQGGSLDATITTDTTDTSAATSFSANFNDCNSLGVVIGGSMGWSMSRTGTDTTMDFTGTLDWSGDVEGECEIDLHYALSGAGVVAYSGSVCGYETSELSM